MQHKNPWSQFKTVGDRRGDYRRRSPLWTYPILFVLIVLGSGVAVGVAIPALIIGYTIGFFAIFFPIGALIGVYLGYKWLWEAYKSEKVRLKRYEKD